MNCNSGPEQALGSLSQSPVEVRFSKRSATLHRDVSLMTQELL